MGGMFGGGAGAPGGGFGGPAGSRSPPRTSAATSATSSATCSAAAAGGAGAQPRAPVRSGAPTSRPSCTWPSTDAVEGVTTTVHLTSDAACSTCHGSGAQPGTTPIVCPQLRRPRRDRRQPGAVLVQHALPAVRAATGMIVEDPCPTCQGTGVERRPREVKVRIPAGVADGQRIRLKGRGGPGRNGGPPGDLYVIVPRRARTSCSACNGRDLTLTVPVTFPEAALGADITVPTLDGARSSCGSRPAPAPAARSGSRAGASTTAKGTGDLLVTVEVAVPDQAVGRRAQGGRGARPRPPTSRPRAHLGVS